VALIGSRTTPQLEDALGALDLRLGPEALARIEAAMPRGAVAGTRYGEEQMRTLDSERS
jgi:aryl-alcohol dehydrogenase-like predicted oxidoreductase